MEELTNEQAKNSVLFHFNVIKVNLDMIKTLGIEQSVLLHFFMKEISDIEELDRMGIEHRHDSNTEELKFSIKELIKNLKIKKDYLYALIQELKVKELINYQIVFDKWLYIQLNEETIHNMVINFE